MVDEEEINRRVMEECMALAAGDDVRVAVITDAHRLTPPLLAALAPAVSEGGRFTRDGRDVRADGATYVLIAALGADAGEGSRPGKGARFQCPS